MNMNALTEQYIYSTNSGYSSPAIKTTAFVEFTPALLSTMLHTTLGTSFVVSSESNDEQSGKSSK